MIVCRSLRMVVVDKWACNGRSDHSKSAVATLALHKDNLLALDPAGGVAGIQYQRGEFDNAAVFNVAVVGSDDHQIGVTESILGELYARSVKAIFADGRSPRIVE